MGGMGGGMRSVPPSGLPVSQLKAGQTRHLPTRLVPLGTNGRLPLKGEKLTLGDVGQANADPKAALALKRLAAEKAPSNVATLVMWNLGGMSWERVATLAKGWANSHELTLARAFVAQLDDAEALGREAGTVRFEIKGNARLADDLEAALKDKSLLGLTVKRGVPAKPEGPSVACKIEVKGTEATVAVAASDGTLTKWSPAGQFTLPVATKDGKADVLGFADGLAEGLLGRLVRAQLSKVTVDGKLTFRVRVDNASPLLLNGLAIVGAAEDKAETDAKVLAGVSISPRRSLTLPASLEAVNALGLRKGVRVIAADLSAL